MRKWRRRIRWRVRREGEDEDQKRKRRSGPRPGRTVSIEVMTTRAQKLICDQRQT